MPEAYKPTAGDTKKATEMLGPKELRMTETRESLLNKLKAETGFDDALFKEISQSFKTIEHNATLGSVGFSFDARGHKIVGSFRRDQIYDIFVNGEEITGSNLDILRGKYAKIVYGLFKLSNSYIESQTSNKAVEDLLR